MSDQLPERCCGRCKFMRRYCGTNIVECHAPIPVLPLSVDARKTLLFVHDGEQCPAFEPATEQETDDGQ